MVVLGPVAGLIVYALMPETYVGPEGVQTLGEPGRRAAGVATWMAVWWLTEALHISVTALVPLVAFPLLGVSGMQQAASPYANDLIYLFMGGFILSLSMQRWGLHRRIALTTLGYVGTRPRRVVGGFMVVTAVLSMWVSNTATAVMMLPIAISVLDLETVDADGQTGSDGKSPFATALLLSIAYAASIGGVGTIIGTPPNVFLASFVSENLGREISFGRWMTVGIPFVVVFLPLAWWVLTYQLFELDEEALDGTEALIASKLDSLGAMNRGERVTLIVFVAAAVTWVVRAFLVELTVAGVEPFGGLTDTGVAMLAAMALFVTPAGEGEGFVMDWETARQLPWGILILFGGGLSLAAAIDETGVGAFLGSQVAGLKGVPGVLIVAALSALVVLLTELTSNTATTATFLPILAGMAPGLGIDPMLLLAPAAFAASCAFMLPVATPPNAIVFGSGRISVAEMRSAGIWLNLASITLITTLAYTLVALVFV